MTRIPVRSDAAPRDSLDEFLYSPDEESGRIPGESAPESPRAADEPLHEYLAFALGAEEYAIPIELVREIVRDPVLTEVPRAPSSVLGVMMIRGQVVPVFDLRESLRLPRPDAPNLKARTVIVDVGRGPFGLMVDGVRQVLRLRDAAIEDTPAGIEVSAHHAFRGIARVQTRMIVLLDVSRIFGSGED